MVSDGHGRVVRIGKLVLVFRYETVIAFMDFRFGYDGVSAGLAYIRLSKSLIPS